MWTLEHQRCSHIEQRNDMLNGIGLRVLDVFKGLLRIKTKPLCDLGDALGAATINKHCTMFLQYRCR